MAYSTKQWKAINHYIKKNDLRPMLSAFPVLRFTRKADGKVSEVHIATIEDFYTAHLERNKRDAREDAKQRKRDSQDVAAKYLGGKSGRVN